LIAVAFSEMKFLTAESVLRDGSYSSCQGLYPFVIRSEINRLATTPWVMPYIAEHNWRPIHHKDIHTAGNKVFDAAHLFAGPVTHNGGGAVTGNGTSKTRAKMLCSAHVSGTYSW
jgi:hypothetical protein